MSFNSITEDAAARNHTFLELLKSNFRNQEEFSTATPIMQDSSVDVETPFSPSTVDSDLTSSFTRLTTKVSSPLEDAFGGR